jgi:ribonuclease T1
VNRRATPVLKVLVVLLVLSGWTLAACGAVDGGATDGSGPATVAVAELPPEAADTIERIASDGPFSYAQDGATFHNRERLLPARPDGYYREYTVVTPGSPDRGARRIVAGDGGELYYTDDHYASFREVTQ